MSEGAWISLEVWQGTLGQLDRLTQSELLAEAEAEWGRTRISLEEASKAGDEASFRYWLHRLVGGAASLGAGRLHQQAEHLRHAFAATRPLDYRPLDEALRETLAELRDLTDRPPGGLPAIAPPPTPEER